MTRSNTSRQIADAAGHQRHRTQLEQVAHPRSTLPAEPLLRQVSLRGGPTAAGLGNKGAAYEAYRRAKVIGRLTPRAAEGLSMQVLGMHPCELWSELWFAAA